MAKIVRGTRVGKQLLLETTILVGLQTLEKLSRLIYVYPQNAHSTLVVNLV